MKTRLFAAIALAAMAIATAATVAVVSPSTVGLGTTRAAAVSSQAGTSTNNIEQNDDHADGEQNDDEQQVAAGTLDDGADLLPQAKISVDQAIATAKTAASGDIGEIDLEHVDGTLVFNVDVGDHDVKVDATSGALVSVDQDD